MTDGVADLHVHSTASDGTASVEERLSTATERGLDAVAITDHDIIATELRVQCESRGEIELVTGVEVRAEVFETKIEILGYFPDPTDDALTQLLADARQFRERRNKKMVERLAEKTSLDLSYETLAAETEGNLGRPHLAQTLVEAGVVSTIQAAFDRYLADEAACFVPMERHPHGKVIRTIRAAGGVSSLAHPGRIRADASRVHEIVATLSETGLDAIEVYYPYSADSLEAYADVGVDEAATLRRQHDLLATGGSDCHGPGSGKFRLGAATIDRQELEAIRDRAASRRPFDSEERRERR